MSHLLTQSCYPHREQHSQSVEYEELEVNTSHALDENVKELTEMLSKLAVTTFL